MIQRIVRLTFKEEYRSDFLILFEKHLSKIETFTDCKDLELFEDKDDQRVFFTYSYWTSEEGLNKYRSSEYFRDIWGTIKPWFEENAQAWSLQKLEFNK